MEINIIKDKKTGVLNKILIKDGTIKAVSSAYEENFYPYLSVQNSGLIKKLELTYKIIEESNVTTVDIDDINKSNVEFCYRITYYLCDIYVSGGFIFQAFFATKEEADYFLENFNF